MFSVNAGVSTTVLLHSKSLRGHRDCFEKCHLIANQKLSHSKVSQSAYEGLKLALSQKLNRIIRFAQNKDAVSSSGCTKRGARFLCYSPHGDCKLLPQSEAQVPRYTPRWDWAKATGLPECTEGMLGEQPAEELELLQESQPDAWSSAGRTDLRRQIQSSGGQLQHRQQHHSREKCEQKVILEEEISLFFLPFSLSSQISSLSVVQGESQLEVEGLQSLLEATSFSLSFTNLIQCSKDTSGNLAVDVSK